MHSLFLAAAHAPKCPHHQVPKAGKADELHRTGAASRDRSRDDPEVTREGWRSRCCWMTSGQGSRPEAGAAPAACKSWTVAGQWSVSSAQRPSPDPVHTLTASDVGKRDIQKVCWMAKHLTSVIVTHEYKWACILMRQLKSGWWTRAKSRLKNISILANTSNRWRSLLDVLKNFTLVIATPEDSRV